MTEQTRPMTIIDLDPGALLRHPANRVVTDERLTELQASMSTELKLLQPPVVVPAEDGGHRIIVGQNRVQAAETLGWPTVPCILREDLTDALALLAVREDNETHEHFSTAERAAIDAELALFPEFDTPAKLANATRRKPKQVEGSLAVHQLGPKAARAVDDQQLSLDDVLELSALNEIEPGLAQKLLDAYRQSHQIRFAMADARRKHQRARLYAEAEQRLTAEGVAVVREPPGFPYSSAVAPLRDLRTADGAEIDAEAVRTKDGFAAIIDFVHPVDSARITYVCLDPEAKGYQRIAGSYRTRDQLEEFEQRRARRDERREQLATAAEVRAKWLTRNLATQAKAAAWLDDILRVIALHQVDLHDSEMADRLCSPPSAGGPVPARKAAHRVVAMTVVDLHEVASSPETSSTAEVVEEFYRLLLAHGCSPTDVEADHYQRCQQLNHPEAEQDGAHELAPPMAS
ncbi:ParB N-terminal domain-containing protein [Crossiella sp. SN42]|uniref:ParB/RepB/Spo0J family partition protein n=1 Tax=Crossiella sp. SN42 TaxID=2944808 RepID=UPI00207C2160|nr:ParB N-terminal domain-containing protein [Crossiella sp. SN42]MCO1580521.1 ParB N-terminal domain-containing protein [Crossiella sp. SN42]